MDRNPRVLVPLGITSCAVHSAPDACEVVLQLLQGPDASRPPAQDRGGPRQGSGPNGGDRRAQKAGPGRAKQVDELLAWTCSNFDL